MGNCNLLKLILFLVFFISLSGYANASDCEMLTVEDYENYAYNHLPRGLSDYLKRGAFNDETLHGNTAAFSKVRVLPRYLRNTYNRTTEATIFNGKTFNLPIGIAPSGLHKRWHPEGENATMRAAAAIGALYIVSSASSIVMEDLVHTAPENTEKWYQTFIMQNKNITYDFVRRAENAGFTGLVITIDMQVPSLRYHNKKNDYKDLHTMMDWVKYKDDTEGRRRDGSTWEDLRQLISSTRLPVIVKGVLTPGDAKLAYENGAKAIIVSNHGGRQLDGTISTIEALEAITREFPDAAEKGFDIYLDSGIRNGLDVFRALALGAKHVFVGRAPMWGLFHSGEEGIKKVMEILRHQLETVMGQVGCVTLDCINRDLITFKF